HRFFRADHRDRYHGDARAHRDLDEATTSEAMELVPLGEQLAGRLRAFGEHEDELPLVVEEAVRVVGVRGDTAAPRPQRADDRYCPEQVLGQPVDAAAELR